MTLEICLSRFEARAMVGWGHVAGRGEADRGGGG